MYGAIDLENVSDMPRPTVSNMAGQEPKAPSPKPSIIPETQVAFQVPTGVSRCKRSWGWGGGREDSSERWPTQPSGQRPKVCFQRGGEFSGTPHVLNYQSRPHTHLLSLPHPHPPLLPLTVEKKIVQLPQVCEIAGPLCVASPCSVGPVSPQGYLALLVPV